MTKPKSSISKPILNGQYHSNFQKSAAKICERSDLHGLNEFYQNFYVKKNKGESCMWLIVFLIALAGLVYFVIDASQEFFSKPILTSYRVQIDNEGLLFPSVYLCYSNPLMNFQQIRYSVNKTWQRDNVNGLLKYSGNETGLAGTFLIDANTNSDVFKAPGSVKPGFGFDYSSSEEVLDEFNCSNSLLRAQFVNFTLRFSSEDFSADADNVSVSDTSEQGDTVDIGCHPGHYLLVDNADDSLEEGFTFTLSCQEQDSWQAIDEYVTDDSPFECVPVWTPSSMEEYFMQAGPPDTFVKECSFGNRAVDCDSIRTAVFDGDRGKCFVLDMPPEKEKQTVSGAGLSILLDVQFEENYGNLSNPDNPSSPLNTPFEAVYLSVTAPGKREGYPASENVLLVEAGTYTMVTLSTTSYELLDRETPLPNWTGLAGQLRCLTDQAQKEIPMQVFNLSLVHYSVAVCQLDCAYTQSLKACGCLPPVDKSILQMKHQVQKDLFCTPAQMNCSYSVINEFAREIRTCSKDCILPCEYQKWSLGTSRVPFPHEKFLSIRTRSIEDENLKMRFEKYSEAAESKSKILLDINYPQLQEIAIEEEYAMTFNNFIANVGGLFGLWLGPSLVTLFKLCFELIKMCLNKRNKKDTEADENYEMNHQILPNGTQIKDTIGHDNLNFGHF